VVLGSFSISSRSEVDISESFRCTVLLSSELNERDLSIFAEEAIKVFFSCMFIKITNIESSWDCCSTWDLGG